MDYKNSILIYVKTELEDQGPAVCVCAGNFHGISAVGKHQAVGREDRHLLGAQRAQLGSELTTDGNTSEGLGHTALFEASRHMPMISRDRVPFRMRPYILELHSLSPNTVSQNPPPNNPYMYLHYQLRDAGVWAKNSNFLTSSVCPINFSPTTQNK